MRKKPRPFTRAEKLETQKGMMKSRAVGQKPSRPTPPERVLMSSAAPTMAETPREVSQRDGLESKQRTAKKRYHSR
jgi:hypothetical protein